MSTLLGYLKLLPLIVSAAQALESALPISGAGKQKLQLILDIVSHAYETEESVREDLGKGFSLDKVVSIVTKIASAFVAIAKATGAFK